VLMAKKTTKKTAGPLYFKSKGRHYCFNPADAEEHWSADIGDGVKETLYLSRPIPKSARGKKPKFPLRIWILHRSDQGRKCRRLSRVDAEEWFIEHGQEMPKKLAKGIREPSIHDLVEVEVFPGIIRVSEGNKTEDRSGQVWSKPLSKAEIKRRSQEGERTVDFRVAEWEEQGFIDRKNRQSFKVRLDKLPQNEREMLE